LDIHARGPLLADALMIAPGGDDPALARGYFVARSFGVDQVNGLETLTISAQGQFVCFVNGRRVGQDLLTPGWTAYDKRLSYLTYDVADLLRVGTNRIEIWLTDGWYRTRLLWKPNPISQTYGDRIGAIAALHGPKGPMVVTDGTWTSGLIPVTEAGLYAGESYDARAEAVQDSAGVEVLAFDHATLIPYETTPVRERTPLAPVRVWQDDQGRHLYDFGQNAAGYVSFTVAGSAGAEVTVEHAEILDKQGRFENANYRSAKAQVSYTLKDGEQSYRPLFTYYGYRYARITLTGDARLVEVASVPISSAGAQVGAFSCANPWVNRLVENTLWSLRSNFVDIPTDCPQRDERLGWTGDAQVFVGTACYLNDSHSFWVKWLRDLMADQRENGAIPHVSPDPTRGHEDILPNFVGSTGWGDAICVVPWALYQHYGDTNILRECLPAMRRWLDYLWSISDGPIITPPRNMATKGFTFGDWLQPKGSSVKPLPTIGDDAAATIYHFISLTLTAKVAATLGDKALSEALTARAETVRAAFRREFVTATGRLCHDDQTSYALAILHDLAPPETMAHTVACFRSAIARSEGRIGTGFIGTPALLPALCKVGEAALAAEVFLQPEVPGWLYQVRNGATTIWERWDAIQADGSIFDPAMNSYNHYAYGAVCQWLFEAVAGFRPDPEKPGFAHILFQPVILPELAPVAAHHDSALGRIGAEWDLAGKVVTYRMQVPDGATATLILPEGASDAMVDGVPFAGRATLPAGTHVATFMRA